MKYSNKAQSAEIRVQKKEKINNKRIVLKFYIIIKLYKAMLEKKKN